MSRLDRIKAVLGAGGPPPRPGVAHEDLAALVVAVEAAQEAAAVLEPITGFFGPRCAVEANKASGLLARALAPLTEDVS